MFNNLIQNFIIFVITLFTGQSIFPHILFYFRPEFEKVAGEELIEPCLLLGQLMLSPPVDKLA